MRREDGQFAELGDRVPFECAVCGARELSQPVVKEGKLYVAKAPERWRTRSRYHCNTCRWLNAQLGIVYDPICSCCASLLVS